MTLPGDGAASVLKALRQEPALWQIPVLATIPSGDKMEELPLAQIASLLHIPSGTVKSRLHQARKLLRQQLEVLLDDNDSK